MRRSPEGATIRNIVKLVAEELDRIIVCVASLLHVGEEGRRWERTTVNENDIWARCGTHEASSSGLLLLTGDYGGEGHEGHDRVHGGPR